MSIYCIGQAVYDMIFPLDEKIIENRKYRVENKIECIGAPATNAASLCGIWNADTSLIARVGEDSYGEKICEQLVKNNVNIDYVVIDKTFQTPVSIVITNTNNGNRTLFNYPSKLNKIEFQLPQKEPDILLVDGHELEVSLQALEMYSNKTSIIDAGSFRDATRILSKKIDYLVCSQDFLYQYVPIDIDIKDRGICLKAFQELRKLTSGVIVLTLGEQGLLYEEDGELHHLPAYKTNAIDTTGAGDVFHGAFAYCLDKGYSLFDTLKIASMAASLSVRKMGGYLSIPTKIEVNKEFKKLEIELVLK